MARQLIQQLDTIQYFRGDTTRCDFTRTISGSAIDISTGYTYLMTVSRLNSPLAATAAANQIMQMTSTIVDGASGVFGFAPLSADYDNINESGDYTETPPNSGILVASFFYDIQESNSSGSPTQLTTIGKGIFQVLMDITK